MRKVNLRMNEQYKYEVIKKLVDTHGNKKNAAIKLNCSVRTIDRLIVRYKAEGKTGFIHKNRNRQPISTFPVEVKNKVIDLYRTKYSGANLLHFSQLLAKKEDIHVSDTTINYWLRSCDILSPKARRKTVNTLNAELRKRKKAAKTKKEAVSIEISLIYLIASMHIPDALDALILAS